ncbi:protein FIZZY-RELATED 2 isoform X2 [Brassica rapa]|uniref:protein FIZZY-RELATED 2 isoform X2 n=1 Tax=Brassica campestris TaxID=3711 RepID=UPI00142D270D|nr:protein FIZZY-RELATED 2 isoform X2 [Brassica rapa]
MLASFLLLAFVGGPADRCICFPRTMSTSINTCSQVCNLAWSKNINKLVSTHWMVPKPNNILEIPNHLQSYTDRFMFLAVSPEGKTNANGAGDETFRFWNVFRSMKAQALVQRTRHGSIGLSIFSFKTFPPSISELGRVLNM